MKRSRLGMVPLALVATFALATNVLASQSQPVTITVESHIGALENEFEATGGIVCEEGTVSNGRGNFVGGYSNTHAQIQLVQHFVCSDGTFDLLARVTLDFTTFDTVGRWSVLDGTGAYERLHGVGSLTGDSLFDFTILDVYTGSMHFD